MNLISLALALAALSPGDNRPPEVAMPPTAPTQQPEFRLDGPGNEPDLWNALSRKLETSLDEGLSRDRRLRRKLTTCERCHSSELSAANNFLPLLQGQNRPYLAAKILAFKTRQDAHHPLRAITRSLTLDDIVIISDFYSRQSSPLQQGLAMPATNRVSGASPSLDACSQCHGKNGNGADLIPDITGQNENYLAYRIREIDREDPKIYRNSLEGAANCRIALKERRESRAIARVLSLAIEPAAIIRGEPIYRLNCASCHDHGVDGAPHPEQRDSWQQRLANGFHQLERNALLGKQKMPMRGGNRFLSRGQIRDAIHFMLSRSGLFSISAPF